MSFSSFLVKFGLYIGSIAYTERPNLVNDCILTIVCVGYEQVIELLCAVYVVLCGPPADLAIRVVHNHVVFP